MATSKKINKPSTGFNPNPELTNNKKVIEDYVAYIRQLKDKKHLPDPEASYIIDQAAKPTTTTYTEAILKELSEQLDISCNNVNEIEDAVIRLAGMDTSKEAVLPEAADNASSVISALNYNVARIKRINSRIISLKVAMQDIV